MTPKRRPAWHFTVSFQELAHELNLDVDGLRRTAEGHGMEYRKRRHPAHVQRVNCVTAQDAMALRAYHAQHRASPESVPHWLTAAQAARALGLSLPAFYQRRTAGRITVHRVSLHGPTCRRRQTRYNPADIAREAARIGIQPRTAPSGTLTTAELSALTSASPRTIRHWTAKGCPHTATVDRDLHFRPAAVLAWLTAQDWTGRHRNRARAAVLRAIPRLQAHLTPGENAA